MRRFWLLLMAAFVASTSHAAALSATVAQNACVAIATHVDAIAGNAPVFLLSYDSAPAGSESDQPALRGAAFAYDNALAVIALLACDKRVQALRVGEALRLATMHDSRLRNAYRAGVVNDKPLPNGWWDAKENRWVEDAYQDGSATGNVAWTALAMLALHEVTREQRWQDAASRLAQWTIDNAADARGAGGFSGGVDGFDANAKKVGWKSTEQNIDLVAVFAWLERLHAPGDWKKQGAAARHFVDSQWDAASGHFFVGTLPDGVTPNRSLSGLDVQMWAQLLPGAERDWQRALAYAERGYGVAGGFDFNTDRDGLWLEGTAQAALAYRKLGRDADASRLFATIAR